MVSAQDGLMQAVSKLKQDISVSKAWRMWSMWSMWLPAVGLRHLDIHLYLEWKHTLAASCSTYLSSVLLWTIWQTFWISAWKSGCAIGQWPEIGPEHSSLGLADMQNLPTAVQLTLIQVYGICGILITGTHWWDDRAGGQSASVSCCY